MDITKTAEEEVQEPSMNVVNDNNIIISNKTSKAGADERSPVVAPTSGFGNDFAEKHMDLQEAREEDKAKVVVTRGRVGNARSRKSDSVKFLFSDSMMEDCESEVRVPEAKDKSMTSAKKSIPTFDKIYKRPKAKGSTTSKCSVFFSRQLLEQS